jgi:hypothetical protein
MGMETKPGTQKIATQSDEILTRQKRGAPEQWKYDLVRRIIVCLKKGIVENDKKERDTEMEDALRKLRANLPDVARIIEEIYYWGNTDQKVADKIGKKIHTVRYFKNLGLKKLKDFLETDGKKNIENKKTPYTPEELAFIHDLCANPEYKYKKLSGTEVNLEKITRAVNVKFHNSRDVRKKSSIAKLISVHKLNEPN